MALFDHPSDIINDDIFVRTNGILSTSSLYLKIEGFSITGSIKIKPAVHIIRLLEDTGVLHPGSRVIESSSGNFGLALSMICASRGYHFTCVSDPNISQATAKLIRAYGADLIIVERKDNNGGYLATRLALIRQKLTSDNALVWINQYENIHAVDAHYLYGGPQICSAFPHVSYIFIGAGTTGTLGGLSRYMREHSPATRVIAVDSIGSVTFGTPPGPRHIPGLGTSEPPPIRALSSYDDLVLVDELQAIEVCHRLAKTGLLLGGSTGTVLAAVHRYRDNIAPNSTVVAISPDLGDRYVDTVYDPDWVGRKFSGCSVQG